MVKVNLLPREDIEKQAIGKFLKWTLSYGRYIIISVELVVFLVFFSRFVYDQQLADLNEHIEQKHAIVASASDFEKKIRTIQQRIDQVKSLNEGRNAYLTVLDRLQEIVPIDMVFADVTFEEEIMTLDGSTLTNESFAKFITSLKTDELFSEISIETVGKKKPRDRMDNRSPDPNESTIEFTISGVIQPYQKFEPNPSPVHEAFKDQEIDL